MASTSNPHRLQLSQQRAAMRAELACAIEDDADPLAAYDDFVKWTLQNYASHSDSGLLELLEETVRKFKDDSRYKAGDLRYVKCWILFANHVDNPAPVYAYMLEKGIGKPYALFFEEYALALEREGRFFEAETVMTLGIRTQAKPLKHLQAFQSDYNARRAAKKPLPVKVSPFREGTCSHLVNLIRTDPLRNIAPKRAVSNLPSTLSLPSASHPDVTMTTTQAIQPTQHTRPNPYTHLNVPPDPAKRPEKLRFDLTLLLDTDGTEYSFEEARARHLGLLGKKWPPPPPPNAALAAVATAPPTNETSKERSVKVDFNDQGTKSARGGRRQSVTVTINTKQALEDVFDMYNSPMKENPDGEQVEEARPRTADTPSNSRTPVSIRPLQDENAGISTKPRAFQPYVDQNRENATPGLLKFKPVTTKTPGGINAFTPNVTRKALVAKDIVTPVPAFKVIRPDQNTTTPTASELRPLAEENPDELDVFGGDDVTTDDLTDDFTDHPPPPPPAPRPFVPFVDESTGKRLLSAPREENAPASVTSKILKFQVHRDENPSSVPPPRKSASGERAPSQSHFQPTRLEEPAHNMYDEDELEVLQDTGDDYEQADASDRQCFARSGRFGNFDVMTPITERTFEFTVSTRAAETPGSERFSMFDKGFVAMDAQDAAEKLAAELYEEQREQEEAGAATAATAARSTFLSPELLGRQGVDETELDSAFSSFDRSRTAPFRISDGFTIEPNHSNLLSSSLVVDRSTTVNLTEVVAARTGFVPPNPCNPSDPEIVAKLQSILPSEPGHRDLRHQVADKFEKLQKFAEKRARRGSGASSSGRVSNDSDTLLLELDGDRFEVSDKLGEGGFGAVFMAKDTSRASSCFNDNDDDDDYDDCNEDEDDGLVAIKAVRPTNLWESYVLRRIVSAIPDDLSRSIIFPHTLYAFKDESFLVLDLCQQGTLLEIVNRATETGVGQPGGGMDELLVMFFTIELLRIVQGLHDRGFIHGDLKIDNCLIRLEDVPGGSSAWSGEYSPAGAGGWANKGLKLIDFGRTIDTTLYPPGQMFIADWKTDGRDCLEMREGRPWTFQTDYSGLASIIYCMLFGKYIETIPVKASDGVHRLKLAQPMKRYWQIDFWNRLFDALLNPCQLRSDGSIPITDELAILRGELEHWIQTNCNKGGKNLKGMLKKIEIATLRRTPRK